MSTDLSVTRRLIVSVEWALTRPNDTAEVLLSHHTKRKCLRRDVCKPAVYTAIQLRISPLLQLVTTLLPSCIGSRHTSQSLWLHRFI